MPERTERKKATPGSSLKKRNGKSRSANDRELIYSREGQTSRGTSETKHITPQKIGDLETKPDWTGENYYYPDEETGKDTPYKLPGNWYHREADPTTKKTFDDTLNNLFSGSHGLTYLDVINHIKKENKKEGGVEPEVMVVGGLSRDIVHDVARKKDPAQSADVDISITLSTEKIGKALNSLRGTDGKKIHVTSKDNGYFGVGKKGADDIIDIFDASKHAMKSITDQDFTANAIYYVVKDKPYFISKSKNSFDDAIDKKLRFTLNWFEAIDNFLERPSKVMRFYYFSDRKGYGSDNLTEYAVLESFHQALKVYKGLSKEERKKEAGAGLGNMSTLTNIEHSVKKMFNKKWKDSKQKEQFLEFIVDMYKDAPAHLKDDDFTNLLKFLIDEITILPWKKKELKKKCMESMTSSEDSKYDDAQLLFKVYRSLSSVFSVTPVTPLWNWNEVKEKLDDVLVNEKLSDIDAIEKSVTILEDFLDKLPSDQTIQKIEQAKVQNDQPDIVGPNLFSAVILEGFPKVIPAIKQVRQKLKRWRRREMREMHILTEPE